MTLYEVFQLLEDGEKLAKMESGGKDSEKGGSKAKPSEEEYKQMAKRKGIRLPSKGF